MTDTNPQQTDRRERYATAIRETDGWVLDDRQHMLDAVMAVADAEQTEMRERYHAGLRRADEMTNELMQEVQRYATGTEQPVLWSVYNAMHLRADNAEAEAERLRAELAAASAPVPPAPADRAAILREAADALVAVAGQHPEARAVVIHWGDAAALLRTMAQEECDELEAQAHLDELADDLSRMAAASGPGGVAGETQQPEGHVYLSTGCLHGDHDYCKAKAGHAGAKRPAQCKFCQAACVCGCHHVGETQQAGCGRCGHGQAAHNASGCTECPGGWRADHRFALADPPCTQHPTAPVIGGMCGGCTQYPADFPKRLPPMDPIHILGIAAEQPAAVSQPDEEA